MFIDYSIRVLEMQLMIRGVELCLFCWEPEWIVEVLLIYVACGYICFVVFPCGDVEERFGGNLKCSSRELAHL